MTRTSDYAASRGRKIILSGFQSGFLLRHVPLDEPLREACDLVEHVRRSYVPALSGRVGRLEHVVALVVDVL